MFDITSLSGQPTVDGLLSELIDEDTMIVLNKGDIDSPSLSNHTDPSNETIAKLFPYHFRERKVWIVSCKTQYGITDFLQGLENQLKKW